MKRTFKTIRGIKKRFRHPFRNVSLDKLFDGDGILNMYWDDDKCVRERLFMSDDLRRELAEIVANQIYSSSRARRECMEALCSRNPKGLEFFQCFYFEYNDSYGEYPYWVSNGLSGDAYDYCKRKFLKANR